MSARIFVKRFPARREVASVSVTGAHLCGDDRWWSLRGGVVAAVSGIGVFPSVGSALAPLDCHLEDKGVMFK